MIFRTIFFLPVILVSFTLSNCRVVITRYEDDCSNYLNSDLIKEIKSYSNVTKLIIHNVKNVSGNAMYKEYSKFIDKFGARLSGSDNLEKSINYMINLTTAYGLNNILTEDVEAPHWVRDEEMAFMIRPRKKRLAILGLGSSVSTPEHGITAEVILIKSFEELDKLSNEDIFGKIVVFNPHFESYGQTVVYRSQGASRAAKKGAVATLIRSITPFSLYTPHTGAQFYSVNVTKIPTACITVEDANLIERLFQDGEKITITLKMLNTIDTVISRNTIIDLKGTKDPGKFVIVSGHIDSWDVGQGAMDDGGGMFISWFAPVVLNQLGLRPRRTLRAILWTAEEMGLIGAASYLKTHKKDLQNINFIMESDEGTFTPLGLTVKGSKTTLCIINEILKLLSPVDQLQQSEYPGSDIVLFVKEGVPGASLLNQNERYFYYHHSEADTMDIQNREDVVNCAAFWAAVSYVIADISVDIPRE